MRTLVELKASVDALSTNEKQKLFLFLSERLRATGELPPIDGGSGEEKLPSDEVRKIVVVYWFSGNVT